MLYNILKNKFLFINIFILLLLFCGLKVSCAEQYIEKDSWEQEDLKLKNIKQINNIHYSFFNIITKNIIKKYQKKRSKYSLSRCPFFISCSNYAVLVIEKYGFIKGICLFIDRNFYRENQFASFYYPLTELDNGILKLDDSFFIYGEGFLNVK